MSIFSVATLTAFTQRLHANRLFEWVTSAVIILSSLTIGMKSYPLSPWTNQALSILDSAITLYFLIEIVLRMVASHSLRKFFSSGWNVFDFFIVSVSLIPVDESEYALLARMLRLFRVMRLIIILPQLRVLVVALLRAIPRVSYVALMMFIIFYIYASIGNLIFKDINPQLWGNIGRALLTLFRVSTFEDWTDVMYETMEVHPFSWIYYLTFIFLSVYVFLNMMIGVIIESFNEKEAADEAEEKARAKQNEAETRALLKSIDNRLAALEQHHRNDDSTR